jgi:hypothetical protein
MSLRFLARARRLAALNPFFPLNTEIGEANRSLQRCTRLKHRVTGRNQSSGKGYIVRAGAAEFITRAPGEEFHTASHQKGGGFANPANGKEIYIHVDWAVPANFPLHF